MPELGAARVFDPRPVALRELRVEQVAAHIWNYVRDAEDGYYREVAHIAEMLREAGLTDG